MDQCATIRESSLAEREREAQDGEGQNPSHFNGEENVHQSFPSV